MLTTSRILTVSALGLASFASAVSAQRAPVEHEILVAVWAEDGQLLIADTDVHATSMNGTVKGTLQESGHFVLPGAGIRTAYGLKTTLEVTHPYYGVNQVDVSLAANISTTLDLAYNLDGELRAFGDSILEPAITDAETAFGTSSNDDCANAVAVDAISSTFGSTIGATFDNLATCGTTITAPGVWYTVTGTGNTMTASTCSPNTTFDSKISVFCGDCDSLNCIGGNDDDFGCGFDTLQSTFSWCSQEGATYYILVHAFDVNEGDFELSMSDDGVPCDDAVGCLATGACCTDGECAILTAPECEAGGGSFAGPFTECNTLIGSRTYSSGLVEAAIPDNDPAGVTDTISAPLRYRVADVEVELFVDHTWTGDIQVTLTHNGVSALIVDRPLEPALSTFGCPEDNWDGIVLDDEGEGGAIEDQCLLGGNLTSPPAYTPNNPLSVFDGLDAGGDWSLTLVDNADDDTGTLLGWRITIASGNGTTICDKF